MYGRTATLTITGHTGIWYYRAGPGNKGTCSSRVAANTSSVVVSDLRQGQTYAFKAYRNFGCTTELAAAEPFTTSELVFADVTSTTANLKLLRNDGPTGDWYYKRIGTTDCKGRSPATPPN